MNLSGKLFNLLLTLILIFCNANVFAQKFSPFEYKVAIIGNPANPDVDYNNAKLEELKRLGFNTLQLNIAWGSRPANEPLNLEDILYYPGVGDKATIEARVKKIKTRAELAKKLGFRTIFHFGAPRVDSLYKIVNKRDRIDRGTEINSIQKNEIIEKYKSLLQRLHAEIPEIDDILVYTFDQEAWIANEFGTGPTDRNIPLHERLPSFLTQLTEAWGQLNKDGRLWWEPWELSAGQIFACIPTLPKKNFGFSIHSNIAEAQLTRPVDVWFKTVLNILTENKIPVIAEFFMASATEEVEPLQYIAAPRLVFEEIEAAYTVRKLTGIKEYYGLLPNQYDPSTLIAGLKLNNPDISLNEALATLSKPYGKAAPLILNAWEASAIGLQLFPWDCTWNFRRLPKRGYVFHDWGKAHIFGMVAASPSWKSTRRSLFMITENETLDPWFYEDIELRSKASADKMVEAIGYYENALTMLSADDKQKTYISNVINDLKVLEQPIRAIQCYCREVNLAYLMRQYTSKNEPIPADLIDRFTKIMETDIANQEKIPSKVSGNNVITARKMLIEFNTDPKTWADTYLLSK